MLILKLKIFCIDSCEECNLVSENFEHSLDDPEEVEDSSPITVISEGQAEFSNSSFFYLDFGELQI